MEEKLDILLERSKSLYFHYPVAAILECYDGTLFYGVNIETSSPAAGVCAERNALFSAISQGYTRDDFKSIHLKAKSNKEVYPCFICRQALVDYCKQDLEIIIYYEGKLKQVLLHEISPFAFCDADLS